MKRKKSPQEKIKTYPKGWKKEGQMLTQTFTFSNFLQAIAFINKIALLAEEANHHPDIELFSYKKVKIKLCTHDAGNRITERDIALAKKISILFLKKTNVY